MMDILKRIDQAQQFCKFYADGAYSVETEKWNHHVNPEFIEDIRQYIESLQLKLMHLQTQQAHRAVCKSESYDMIDRFLRNNLYDDDYESYSEALDEIAAAPVTQRKPLTQREIELIDGMIEVQRDHAKRCDNIANRTMADKQQGWDMERVNLLLKLKAAHGIKEGT